LLAAVVIGFGVFLWPDAEPRYEGKLLTQWVLATPGRGRGAEDALQHIGTNALPYLVKWIQYETPAWKIKLRKVCNHLPAKLKPRTLYSDSKLDRANSCASAFAVLGHQSAPVVPDLCRLLDRPNTNPPPALFHRSRQTFLVLGTNVFPEVLQLLTNRANLHRLGAANALAAMPKDSQTAPVLIGCLQDPHPLITELAARSLGEIRLLDARPVDQTIAILTNALQSGSPWVREQITLALAKIGMYRHNFDPAWHSLPLPALTNALTDLDLPVRDAATNAIKWWTDPDGTNFAATSGTLFGVSAAQTAMIARGWGFGNATNSVRLQMPANGPSNRSKLISP
jgi:hypothetical protein